MKPFLDFMNTHNRRIVAPIGGEIPNSTAYEPDLKLHCCGFIDMCLTFGLETYILPSSGLKKVKEGQIQSIDFFDPISHEKLRMSFLESYENELRAMINKNSSGFIGGGCFGPATVVAEMIGIESFLRKIIKNPSLIDQLTNLVYKLIQDIAQMCKDLNVDYFWIAEPSAVLLSPSLLRRFSGNPLQTLFKQLNIPSFLHVCGDTTKHTEELVRTGANCLSLDHCVDLTKMVNRVPKDVWLMGNIDPMLLYQGSDTDVEVALKKQLKDMDSYIPYIVSTGCLLPQGTPKINIKKVYDIVRSRPLNA